MGAREATVDCTNDDSRRSKDASTVADPPPPANSEAEAEDPAGVAGTESVPMLSEGLSSMRPPPRVMPPPSAEEEEEEEAEEEDDESGSVLSLEPEAAAEPPGSEEAAALPRADEGASMPAAGVRAGEPSAAPAAEEAVDAGTAAAADGAGDAAAAVAAAEALAAPGGATVAPVDTRCDWAPGARADEVPARSTASAYGMGSRLAGGRIGAWRAAGERSTSLH